MPRTNLPVPKDPKDCPPWLYEYLKRLRTNLDKASTGIAQVVRGEVPDGSGGPLVDLSQYFYKPGLATGQLGYGGTQPGEDLILSSTASATKGFIYLGHTTPIVSIDEVSALVGVNASVPESTLHVVGSSAGASGAVVPNSDINSNWVARGGGGWAPIGGTLASAMSSDDGVSTMGTINTSDSGTNPQICGLSGTILPGATYVVTGKLSVLSSSTAHASFVVYLTDTAGNRWAADENGDDIGPDFLTTSPDFYTFTRTVTCSGTPAGTSDPNTSSIRLEMECTTSVFTALYIGCTYVAIEQEGASLIRWDKAGDVESGYIDLNGKMGIGTALDALSAMLTVEPDTAGTVGALIKGATSQSGNLLEFRNSSSTLLARVTSAGVWDGPINTISLVSVDDNAFTIRNDNDSTKTLKFELGGATAGADLILGYSSTADRALNWTLAGTAGNDLTLAATLTGDRTITFPDETGTLVTKENNVTIGGIWTFDPGFVNGPLFMANDGAGVYSGAGPALIDSSGSGFVGEFQCQTLTDNRGWMFPDGSGTLVLTNVSASLLGNTSTRLTSNTSSSGASFMDTTISTKRVRFVMSGSSSNTNNALAFVTTGSRTFTFRDTAGGVVVDSGSALTSGRVPFATTGGALNDSSLFTFSASSGLTISALNIITDTSTGMKIGTATSQKLGFWNATPAAQPTTAVAAATFVANTSAIVDDSATFDGYTIGQVVKALRNMGLLA